MERKCIKSTAADIGLTNYRGKRGVRENKKH